MREAIRLAKKGIGRTSPNPIVGAVIVKNGRILGKGFHRCAGGPHAEINALRVAGDAARGATLYVTLEPCSTHGKTPPCTDAIISSGIRKAVIGTIDPNPRHAGNGIDLLRKKGITVSSGVLASETKSMNSAFNKFITQKLPFVTVKAAMTLDGKLATVAGDSKWITNQASRAYAHLLRREHDAVLVGINTVKKDAPSLTVRYGIKTCKQPYRVVLDREGNIPLSSKLLDRKSASRTIVIVTKMASDETMRKIESRGARVIVAKEKDRRIDIGDALRILARHGITSVLVEGGSQVITSFFEAKAADKVVIFIAPKLIGGDAAPTLFAGKGIRAVKNAVQLHDVTAKRFADDILIEGYPTYK